MSNNQLKILFVDDEHNILNGLRRMLFSQRSVWEMFFASGGHEALELLSHEPIDLIVSDMRMPKMDGVEFLSLVREKYPQTIRFILSGHADKEMIIRSIGPTHQFLAKPCDVKTLTESIQRAIALREFLGSSQLKSLVQNVSTLPALPAVYQQLSLELKRDSCTAGSIAKIIMEDVGITAKTLQLVNSSFFGLKHEVPSVAVAISLLGLETVNSLILAGHVFHSFSARQVEHFHLNRLHTHSFQVGNFAKAIIKLRTKDNKLADMAFLTGLMHDIGILVMVLNSDPQWEHLYTQQSGDPLYLAEKQLLAVTHGEIGAYLLGIWGLSDMIVEAVAYHHNPSECRYSQSELLLAVHLADVFDHCLETTSSLEQSELLDRDFAASHQLDTIQLEELFKTIQLQYHS